MNTFLLIELYWHGSKHEARVAQNEINGVLAFYIETAEHPVSEPEPTPPIASTMKAHAAPCDGFSKNGPGKRAWFLSFKR
jgi:hypothetical protein